MLACFAAGCPSRHLLEHLLRTTDAKQRVRGPASGLWSLLEMCPDLFPGCAPWSERREWQKECVAMSTNTALGIFPALGASCVIQCSDAAGEAPVFTCYSVPFHLAAGVRSICAETLCRPASAQLLLQVLPPSLLSAARSVFVRQNPSAELLQFGPDFIHRRGRHP